MPRIPDPPPGEPWDRQPDESPVAYAAFIVYRDQLANGHPGRSTREVAREVNKAQAQIGRWSSRHRWVRRVDAYDREQEAVKLQAMSRELERVARRQATSLGAAAQALLQPIQAYLSRLSELQKAGEDPFAGWTLRELTKEAREAARLIPQLVQAERLVHGLSTSNVGGHDGGPVAVDVRVQEARSRVRAMGRAELEELLAGQQN